MRRILSLLHERPPANSVVGAALLGAALLPAPASAKPLAKPTWLGAVTVTEYYPAPEAQSVSRLVRTAGLPGRHRADWLYSSSGMAMEGDGIGLDGHWYHVETVGSGWVNVTGRATFPGAGAWTAGSPAWLSGTYWLSATGARTFPLGGGAWTDGLGLRFHPPVGVSFGAGQSRPLTYYRSIAVDPGLIPRGSRIYLPDYRWTRFKGWFVAADTGGAIIGRHVDVFRPAPATPGGPGT